MAAGLAANADGEIGDGSRLMIFEPIADVVAGLQKMGRERVTSSCGLEVAVAEEFLHGAAGL